METRPERTIGFLDSTVLFSAAYSSTGAAYQVLLLGLAGLYHLCVSQYVTTEVRRNLEAKAPTTVPAFEAFALLLSLTPDPPLALVRRACAYVVAKDAPIIAAAVSCGAT